MSLLIWSSNYSVRVNSMDEQHRRLIDLINQLHDAVQHNNTSSVRIVLSALVDYTRTHFADEECLMQTHNYPALTQHKAQHQKFTAQVIEVQKQFLAGKQDIGRDTLAFLKEWLINHIMATDKSYGQYLAGKGLAA